MVNITYIYAFLLAFGAFIVIDLFWLGVVAPRLYQHFMGDLIADSPNWVAAVLFYLIFIGGLTYFALVPALEQGSLQQGIVSGAIYGLVTYATYDLTNLAVLRGFPVGIVPIDMAWGIFLSAAVTATAYLAYEKFLL